MPTLINPCPTRSRETQPQPPAFTAQVFRPRPQLATRGPRIAENDFLVPNPRPDLTTDVATLRMFER